MVKSTTQMDMANRALCYALRKPPKGVKKTSIKDIIAQKLVVKLDGKAPSPGAISEAANTFKEVKNQRGRKTGWRKTTKQEDTSLLQTFRKVRPPGHAVDSRVIHSNLPAKLKKKITRKTVINRLAEKGIKPKTKIAKNDYGPKWRKARLAFTRANRNKTAAQWQREVDAIGDIKEFTYYPKVLQPRFKQLRAPWTYMTEKERYQPAFLRPKRWFKKADYKKTMKCKIFGLTASNGAKLAFVWPKGGTAEMWAAKVKKVLIPFLKKQFPQKQSFQLLLDGESIFHGVPTRAAYASANIKAKLPNWPASSPDLNPQENVWPVAEKTLRTLAGEQGTFAEFQKAALKAVRDYPDDSAKALVGNIAKKVEQVFQAKGGAIPEGGSKSKND